jgi:hypothetical protein
MMHTETTDKMKLLYEIREILYKHKRNIYATKQIIPWTATNIGPIHAVTTNQVGQELEIAFSQILETLRKYDVQSNTEVVF